MIDRRAAAYLEWARLEAGLADGDKTLPDEEHGEREEPTICICPEDDKKLLLFSGGDLGRQMQEGTERLQIRVVTQRSTQYIKGRNSCLKAVLMYSAKPHFKFMQVQAAHRIFHQWSFGD